MDYSVGLQQSCQSLNHRDGGWEQVVRRHARRRSTTTFARPAAVYVTSTTAAGPAAGIPAKPVYHGWSTVLRSGVGRRVRWRIRLSAARSTAAAAAAGDCHLGTRIDADTGRLRGRDVQRRHHLFLSGPLVLQLHLWFDRLDPGLWVVECFESVN